MTSELPYTTATDVFITDLKNLYLNALNTQFSKSSQPFRNNLIWTSWSIEEMDSKTSTFSKTFNCFHRCYKDFNYNSIAEDIMKPE